MKARVLFVNTAEPRCGVHSYGENLFCVLCNSKRYEFAYTFCRDEAELKGTASDDTEAIIYNHSPNIGGWMSGFPFRAYARHHVAVYHDGHINHEALDAVLFSDPTMPQYANWYPIGRPLPNWTPIVVPKGERPVIGVNGFMGAWAILAVRQILHEFHDCVLRLHLPSAAYGDADGAQAEMQLQACKNLAACRPGVTLDVQRDFMPMGGLLSWLSRNDLNVYVRDLPPKWRGVSSVLDPALAVRRPIAVNLCTAFRHVHGLNPSICIEHNDLRTILQNDISPLLPLYKAWAPETVRGQVEDVLDRVFEVDTHCEEA